MSTAQQPTPATPAPRRVRRGRWIAVVIAAVLTFVILVAIVIGFVGFGFVRSEPSYRVTVEDDRVAFVVKTPGRTAIRSFVTGDGPDCPTVSARFTDHGLSAYAAAKSCAVKKDQRLGNGRHGTYRTLADVSDPSAVERIDTWLGPADVFEQDYFECTNFCSDHTEPVAIVTLSEPVDPDYPTLVLFSEKGELSREDFTELVRGLSTPN